MGDAIEAWVDSCRRLEALGRRLGDDDFPPEGAARARGVAHVAEQVLCWTGWSVFHADPRRPAFQRQNDLITQWGGPNADNVYRHARVERGRRYRIRGHMHTCEEFVLAVRAGFMHQPTWGTLLEVTATELGLGPGDAIDITVGEGGQVELPEGALTVSIREYYFDWQEGEPATMVIECVDDDALAPAAPLTEPDVAARLDEAVLGVEHSVEYWNRYMHDRRAEQEPNAFGPAFGVDKGLDAARYAFCFWELGPDDALVVEVPRPDARYWSFQLYDLAWFELIDVTEHQSALNHTQVHVDDDDRVRVVVARQDPGVANWLDAGDRTSGLLTFRCFWAADAPTPSSRLVPLSDVAATLPTGTATATSEQRADTMRARRRHLGWRFRT